MKKYFAQTKIWLFLMVFALLMNNIVDVFVALFMQKVADFAIAGEMEQLVQMMIKGVMFLILSYVSWYLYTVFRARFLMEGKYALKRDSMNSILKADINKFSGTNTAKYLTIFSTDAGAIELDYLDNIPYIAVNVVALALYIGVLFYFSVPLAIVDLTVSMLLLVIPILLGKKMETAQRNYTQEQDRFNARTKDILNGFEVIKSFGAEQKIAQQFADINRSVEKKQFLNRKIIGLNQTLGEGTGYLISMLNYSLGAFLVIKGDITIGAMLGAMQMVARITFPLLQIMNGVARYKGNKANRERVQQLEQLEETSDRAKQPINELFPIEIRDLHFGYTPDKPILNGVDWTLEAGKKYAIVGGSGSGKSTLIKLIMDYYSEFTGQITMSGQNIREVDRRDIYHKIAMIQQNVIMFDDSFRNNITMYEIFPDDKIWEALQEAGLKQLAEKLPQGLDSRIKENGKNFSGGERQRISIARAFIRNAPMVIMDEATSSLDNQNAFQIEQDILTRKDLTALVVTHKLNESILKLYDEIIVLQHGKIIEKGSFQQLMENQKYFYNLYNVSGNLDI